MDMTNPNYYHRHKQEDATRVITSFKNSSSQSDTKITSSPVRSTAPNSVSSSPLSFGYSNNNLTISNPSSNNGNIMTATFSRGPLSPQSAPPTTSVPGFGTSDHTNPVPSVIHTGSRVDGETNTNNSFGSAPYFPTMKKSSSGNMSTGSSSSNLVAKRGTTKVTGKKKHQTNKPKSGSNSTLAQSASSPRPHDGGGGTGSTATGQKKQRRLERNRLSAQLSRRRRKQYLEELEDRVVQLSLDMDSGRRAHAFQAIDRITELRQQVLESAEAVVREIENSVGSTDMDNNNKTMMLEFQLDNYLRLLENSGALSRTNSEELLILNSFLGQQLKSFSLPSHAKFILWLSLQGDIYYRGGRAASERLSAARIGERMLASGHDKVSPTNAMWPLVCNEVGLSYELEERLRVYQRTTILQEKSTWLDRHSARSSALVMQSFHDSVGAMTQMVGKRENSMNKEILTPSQRVKYLAWAKKNSNRMKARLQARRDRAIQQQQDETETDPNDISIGTYVDSNYQLNKSHHLAANLYILNHQLLWILKDFPYQSPSILTPPVLKKLMRRASFESLGQQKDADSKGMFREDSSASSNSMKSLPSNGSLLKSTSNLSLGGASNDSERPAQLTPQVGEQAAVELVDQALGFVKPIIPPIPKPMNPVLSTIYAPTPVSHNTASAVPTQDGTSSMAVEYHSHHIVPTPVTSYAPTQLAPAPPSSHQVAPISQYEGMTMHHYPNHPVNQLNSHNYTTSHARTQVQHTNTSYQPPQQTEHYYSPQQHVHYASAPASSVPAQMTPIDHEPIAPVYETSSSAIQHQHPVPLTTKSRHERKSSFLPASLNSLNVVPEDMFPGVEGTAADFIELQDCLMDGEDWGIGIGLDMDTTA